MELTQDPAVVTVAAPWPRVLLGALLGAIMSCALAGILVLALPVGIIGLLALGTLMTGGNVFGAGGMAFDQFVAELVVVVVALALYGVGQRLLRRMLGTRRGKAWFWYFLWPLLLVFGATFTITGFVAYVSLHGSRDPSAIVIPIAFGLTVAAIGGAIATAQRVGHFYRVTSPRTP